MLRQVEVIRELGKLVSSTFDKKRMTPHSVFLPGFNRSYSIVYIDENYQPAIIFFINLDQDLRQGHEVGTTYFLGKVLEMFTII